MMKSASKTGFASLAMLCGLGWLVVACPASLDDRCADGACVAAATSSEGGGGDGEAGADGPVTDPCVDNPTALDCLSNENAALFVRPTGNDADPAAGSKASPFKTINAALAKITPKKRRIYVCTGAYFEDLSLNTVHTGVSIFGGVDCAWNPDPTSKPVIGASASPLKVDGVNGLAIADIAFVAKDAATGSSIAAFVVGSDVSFKRVRLAAGTGGKGDVGVRADFMLPTNLNGMDGSAGGGEKLVPCPGGLQTVGGKGGANGFDGASGSPGPDNKGTVGQCGGSTPAGGGNGAVGTSPPAAAGAAALGELTGQGWQPSSGHDGINGGPGQGGGGGAGLGGGTGGGGGAGGCGGAGGGGGKGGGASVALVSVQSNIHLSESVLQAKDAGSGGAGANGQAGSSAGGFGGAKAPASAACNGGTGGPGGTGAAGGGGAGGVSAGILSKGPKPMLDDSTSKTIVFGMKGAAGAAAGQQAGVDGVAQAIVEIP